MGNNVECRKGIIEIWSIWNIKMNIFLYEIKCKLMYEMISGFKLCDKNYLIK